MSPRQVRPPLLWPPPEALADATLKQLNDDANRRTLTEIFTEMHIALRQNTSQRAAEAAAYLIDEGIKTQGPLLERVQQKLSEIERLRAELRGMIKEKEA